MRRRNRRFRAPNLTASLAVFQTRAQPMRSQVAIASHRRGGRRKRRLGAGGTLEMIEAVLLGSVANPMREASDIKSPPLDGDAALNHTVA